MRRQVMIQMTVLGATLMAAFGCSTAPDYQAVEPSLDAFEPFELPLHVNEQGVATVTVQSSAGPLELILDTGADQAILLRADADVAEQLQRTGWQFHFNARGKLSRMPTYRIDEVHIGPLRYTTVRASTDDSDFPQFMPGEGMLGRGLLGSSTLDIDIPAGRLRILPAGAMPADFDAFDWITAELLDMSDGPVIGVRLDDSDRLLRMVLDTGAIATGPDGLYGTVELPAELRAQQVEVEGWPAYRAETVHIGDDTIGPMNFFVVDHPQPPGTHGFLGNAVFATHRVVIDPAGMRVFIRSVGNAAHIRVDHAEGSKTTSTGGCR